MQNFGANVSSYGVENLGIKMRRPSTGTCPAPMLYEQIIRRREGTIAHLGPIVVHTGDHTGRSPNDKFTVKEPTSENDIWWGRSTAQFLRNNFDRLYRKMTGLHPEPRHLRL